MKKYLLAFSLSFVFIVALFAQVLPKEPVVTEVYVATFKNDASGAYTLIHDDFGADWAAGIEQYADTMAFNRGIPFSFAVITKECNNEDWKKAKELMTHGHQIINHSMSHSCGKPLEWCTAGNWDEKNFNIEIDKSTSLIEENTGVHPAFFIFPYDLFTDTMITYLQSKNYAGARAGEQNVLQNADIKDPFRLNFKVLRPEQSILELNTFADYAADKKAWAIRVTHGVNDNSWAKINLKDYAGHLDHLKKLKENNRLWVDNMSDIALYSYRRENYKANITKVDAKGRVLSLDFASQNSPKVNTPYYKTTLTTSKSKTLTVVVIQNDLKVSKAVQKDKEIPFKILNGKILIDGDPDNGPINLKY